MASISWKWLLQIIIGMLGPLLGQLTPVIKSEMNVFLTGLYKKALDTPNPYDDLFIGLLLDILAIPRPPPD